MKKPVVSLIVAIAETNRVMGNQGKLPWHIPADLKRFKELTSGHPIIMGRKTYESIGRPLPNRTNIIITHDLSYQADECIVLSSLDDALEEAQKHDSEEVFIIGGGEVFRLAMGIAERLYLTLIKGDITGDVFFPEYSAFNKVISEDTTSSNGYEYAFFTLEKSND